VLEDEIKEGIRVHKHPIYTLIISPLEASKSMPDANSSPSPQAILLLVRGREEGGRERGREGGDYSS
jgi:hypothetical protein